MSLDFYSTLLAHGLRPTDSPTPDGKMRRVKTDAKPTKKNGWYKLAFDGTIGWFGDFTTGLSATWRADEEQVAILPIRRVEELAAKREKEKKVMKQAIASAHKAWHNLSPMRELHPYLILKNLTAQGCDSLRIDVGAEWFRAWYKHLEVELHITDDLLIVPMRRGGRLVSLQAITHTGKKLFWKNAPTKGTYLDLTRSNSSVTILTEGIATGLCLFQCIPHARVIVAFTADNLIAVAPELNLTGMCVVAADNDHETALRTGSNPGIVKGNKAGEAIGCPVVWPEGIVGSDWLDAKNEWGETGANEVRRQVMQAVRPVRRVQVPAV